MEDNMRINTNISAMTVNNSLQRAQNNLSASIERLSSGYKINSSADDPAGCAISEKMRMQIRGLNQADNNAADGESVLNTAEGALQEINAMLVRMKELTVQAANDVNSDQERSAIQDELNSINEEIDRITSETEFNTQPLLNLQAIAVGDGTIAMSSTDTIAKDEVGSISINGYDINISEGDDLNTVVSKLMTGADMTGGKMFVTASLTNDTSDKPLEGTKKSDGTKAPQDEQTHFEDLR